MEKRSGGKSEALYWVLRDFLYILVEGLFWDMGRLNREDTLNSIFLNWIKHICSAMLCIFVMTTRCLVNVTWFE